MTVLSVNLNKICLLRNSRGGQVPDLLRAARTCVEAGCGGLTLHPRPDRRHALPEDCHALKQHFGGVELNLEGNPYSQAEQGYPGFLTLVEQVQPSQATLVPDARGQLTSDHGFDLQADAERLRPVLQRLRDCGCRISVFMDAEQSAQLPIAVQLGIDRIEWYTGPYAQAHAQGGAAAAQSLAQYAEASHLARSLGLGVNAGHDLDTRNLADMIAAIDPDEVSIGHALIADALDRGLEIAVTSYLLAIAEGRARSVPQGRESS